MFYDIDSIRRENAFIQRITLRYPAIETNSTIVGYR